MILKFQNLYPILCLLFAAALPAAAQTSTIRSGINQEILSDALDPGDMKIILENIMRTAVFGELTHETKLYRDGDALLQGLDREEFDIFAMTTLPYIENKERDIEPALVLQSNGKKWVRYLVLANRKLSEGKVLADYADADLAMIDNGLSDLLKVWLDVELGRLGLARADEFFGKIDMAEKPNAAAIPVYFGKRELCVISEDNWDVLALLNPKLKERLRVVASSPQVVTGLMLFRGELGADLKRRCHDALTRLHESPEGEQILRFGRIEKIVPVEEADLKPSLDLYSEHQELWGGGTLDLASENKAEEAK